MDNNDYRAEKLSDVRIVELLGMASPLVAFEQFAAMPPAKLAHAAVEKLEASGLVANDASRLLGVKELTVKRWFQSEQSISEQARSKLAGLCLLLSLREDATGDTEATRLVDAAIGAVANERQGRAVEANGGNGELVETIFGIPGLMAAALCSAIGARRRDGSRIME